MHIVSHSSKCGHGSLERKYSFFYIFLRKKTVFIKKKLAMIGYYNWEILIEVHVGLETTFRTTGYFWCSNHFININTYKVWNTRTEI